MKRLALFGAAAAIVLTGGAFAQEGIGRNDADGNFRALSDHVKVFGGFDFAEA